MTSSLPRNAFVSCRVAPSECRVFQAVLDQAAAGPRYEWRCSPGARTVYPIGRSWLTQPLEPAF